ncbi:hypothetical protein [Dactylosporangium matsuzakiense]|uniref:Uncharacterized protein n=1 Tax=Dactylosporangium matsuzakiense TaxID=53360 RepID=A0A9W6NL04_9ACTN|nr:hypothetical protein [Dactylosporangium matsuzakiense]GLL00854.1 hypothetical protein GCM10017581_025950 [Dactylosporangium matsuzakiense]
MLIAWIIGCEIAFWVVLAAGLSARYLLRRRRLGAALLVATAVIDLGLLVVAAVDLRGGGVAGRSHAIAAVFLGFSVVFGHSMIRWADVRFAHRFAGGPPPRVVPKRGPERVRYEWREWGKAVLGGAVAVALLQGGRWWIGDDQRTEALQGMTRFVGFALAVWLLGWPVWVSVVQLLTAHTFGRKQNTSKTKRR